ncbi:MAG: GNAT family N-acetyltransferase [Ktedonobacterales bacterium]
MVVTPRVETASNSDLEALARQRTAEGWLRSETLLRAILAWDRGRIFLVREGELNAAAEDPRTPIATTSAIAAGAVGVIGNVITSERYRRRGLGRLVMEASLAWLRTCGVRAVLLDATEDGRPLYTKLGFVGQASSIFGHGALAALNREALATLAGDRRAALAELAEPGALARVAALDAAAFGGERIGFLAPQLTMPGHWLYVAGDTEGAPAGYVLARLLEAPYSGIRIGPLVARDGATAAALLAAALAPGAPWRHEVEAHPTQREPQVFVSLPSTSAAALALFTAAGLTLVEDDLIMRLDFAAAESETYEAPPLAERPDWLYAWLAPMVF